MCGTRVSEYLPPHTFTYYLHSFSVLRINFMIKYTPTRTRRLDIMIATSSIAMTWTKDDLAARDNN